ncbi:MAG: CRISPR-associated DxTHG motif protein [Candidatus Omnitrophica bacterium]|nr:CRISPR-associated DxTHG motif protein [Candidatus Omnitrophota bacterium]
MPSGVTHCIRHSPFLFSVAII